MKVILLRDVRTVGRKGEIKEVSEGYARNFLFPKQLAQPATEGAIKIIALEKESIDNQKQAEITRYKAIMNIIQNSPLLFTVRAGGKGKTFGSVSAKDIQQKLHEQGLSIEKDWLILPGPIKNTGETKIKIQFPYGVVGEIFVTIQAE